MQLEAVGRAEMHVVLVEALISQLLTTMLNSLFGQERDLFFFSDLCIGAVSAATDLRLAAFLLLLHSPRRDALVFQLVLTSSGSGPHGVALGVCKRWPG